jgi:hypothetical protein
VCPGSELMRYNFERHTGLRVFIRELLWCHHQFLNGLFRLSLCIFFSFFSTSHVIHIWWRCVLKPEKMLVEVVRYYKSMMIIQKTRARFENQLLHQTDTTHTHSTAWKCL